MALKLRKGVLSDVAGIVDAFFDSFRNHPATLRVFKPTLPQSRDWWLKSITNEIQDPNAHFVVVTAPDSDTPDIILGFARWTQPRYPDSPPSPADLPWPEGCDMAFVDEFFGTLEAKHKEIMQGRPHWYLELLGTRQDYQGKGIGKQLLQWGLERIDEDNVEAYLSGSPSGTPMYKKAGFEIVDTKTFMDGAYPENFMRRRAQGKPE
ncbi:acyl-CoA N-acyltransferase [Xylariomycetidae sp. FL2044]|nr:acyl-CoA N-acyltransferase [Xylariomycetidae sp. FL2044]